MTSVLCVGIATLDFIYAVKEMPKTAEKHPADRLVIVSGGIAANAAVAIARLGGGAVLASRIGDDVPGAEILNELHREDVDCAYVRGFPGMQSPVSTILIDRTGERMIVSFRETRYPTEPTWLPDDLPPEIDAVLGDTRWEEAGAKMFAAARRAGKFAVLDGDRAPQRDDILPLATHVAFSHQGIRGLTGEDNPKQALLKLAAQPKANGNGTWFAVTVGADGVFYLDHGEVRHEPAFIVDAVDTLGAGDVWHGAFTLALAEGQPERDAIRFASAVSAIKCTRFGGHAGAPKRREVEAFLRERG
jgi:sulfofructose kinase